MSDCLFCKIINKEIPSLVVYEDDLCLAFRDIAPQAPCHILLIPKKHISSMAEVCEEDASLMAHLMTKIPWIAAKESLTGGFRVVTNSGEDGAQSVKHLHFHILGGKALSGQMG